MGILLIVLSNKYQACGPDLRIVKQSFQEYVAGSGAPKGGTKAPPFEADFITISALVSAEFSVFCTPKGDFTKSIYAWHHP